MSQDREALISRSLRLSYFDGIFISLLTGFTQDYYIPFLLFLGGSAQQVGVLSALPNFFSALVQIKSAQLSSQLQSRQRLIVFFAVFQAFVILGAALLALLNKKMPLVFIALVILFAASGAIANPAWGSLMSDLVPEKNRGDYFGWRNRNLSIVNVAAAFAAGLILHKLQKGNSFNGFFIIFACAFIFRLISSCILRQMYEPPLKHSPEHHFTLLDFIKRFKKSNFAKFVLFVSLMNFSVNVASPFFPVFMLTDLKLGYLLFTLLNITVTITILFTIRRWGRHADSVGNLRVMKLTARMIAVIPLIWILCQHPANLFFAQIFSGLAWAGFNLCCANFVLDAVTPEKRTRCIAYFNLFNGLGLCCGALLGSWLVKKLPTLLGHQILTLMLISSVLRIFVSIIMPKLLKEVREVKPIHSLQLFFSVIGVRPIITAENKPVRY